MSNKDFDEDFGDSDKFEFDYEFDFDKAAAGMDSEYIQFDSSSEEGQQMFRAMMQEIPDDKRHIMSMIGAAGICHAEESCVPGSYVPGMSAVLMLGHMGSSADEEPELSMVALPIEACKKLGEIAAELERRINNMGEQN